MNGYVRFFSQTFGCKVNQYESAWLSERFRERGYVQADSATVADVVVVHTCTVTSKSDSQCRQAVRKLVRENPEARVLVTGCYARLRPDDLTAIGGTVFKQNDFSDILQYLDSIKTGPVDVQPTPGRSMEFPARSRAFVKIQDGCDSHCSYCIVPKARGKSRSQSPQAIIEDIAKFEAAGYREIVLTGVHIGTYGKDLVPETCLAGLLNILLGKFEGLRFRLSSIEPGEIDETLLDLLGSGRICPHLHLPLQSASARILKLMKRPYGPEEYKQLVEKILAKSPYTAIGTDVMVGFPSETDVDFQQTKTFVESLPFAYFHVFVYSIRPDTPAAALKGQLHSSVKKERGKIIREISERKRHEFIEKNMGTIRPTVVLDKPTPDGDGHMGLTDNYLRVCLQEGDRLTKYSGKVLPARLTEFHHSTASIKSRILW